MMTKAWFDDLDRELKVRSHFATHCTTYIV